MPAACGEFTAGELAYALAEHRGRAEDLLTLALTLETRLPGTRAALRDGIIRLTRPGSSLQRHCWLPPSLCALHLPVC